MKTYLSYGGGVNSTACVVLHEQGKLIYDEAVYVDHGGDWPETRQYVWDLKYKHNIPITILKPSYKGFDSLYYYLLSKPTIATTQTRDCSSKFKTMQLQKYVKTPAFMLIGFSSDEAHRAKLKAFKGTENRFPLIEMGINREGCKDIIRDFRLSVPMKSGCFFCPFQRLNQWKELRRNHPDLFCKAEKLENKNNANRKLSNKDPMYIYNNLKCLSDVVKEKAEFLFEEMEYPPCNCEL